MRHPEAMREIKRVVELEPDDADPPGASHVCRRARLEEERSGMFRAAADLRSEQIG